MRKILASVLCALFLLAQATYPQSGCVIPGATTVVVSASFSALAADTGKVYWTSGTTAIVSTLPSTPPTAVWRIKVNVAGSGCVTFVDGGGATINYIGGLTSFCKETAIEVTTDGTSYYVGSRTGIPETQSCDIVIGDQSASAITNVQLGPQFHLCYIPVPATIIEVDVANDAGTSSVILGVRHVGTVNNILSAALSSVAGATACSNVLGSTSIAGGSLTCSSTLQNTALATGDYIELVSGTAGGTAKLMTAHVIYSAS
jgi:hypothetical protein